MKKPIDEVFTQKEIELFDYNFKCIRDESIDHLPNELDILFTLTLSRYYLAFNFEHPITKSELITRIEMAFLPYHDDDGVWTMFENGKIKEEYVSNEIKTWCDENNFSGLFPKNVAYEIFETLIP